MPAPCQSPRTPIACAQHTHQQRAVPAAIIAAPGQAFASRPKQRQKGEYGRYGEASSRPLVRVIPDGAQWPAGVFSTASKGNGCSATVAALLLRSFSVRGSKREIGRQQHGAGPRITARSTACCSSRTLPGQGAPGLRGAAAHLNSAGLPVAGAARLHRGATAVRRRSVLGAAA
jgi:hypothetical protein